MHWSDESRLLLNPVDCPLPRIETEKHSISTGTYGTPAFDGGGVTVWGAFL